MRKHGLTGLATLAALMLAATPGAAQDGDYWDAEITLPPQEGLVRLRVVGPEQAQIGETFNYRLDVSNTADNVILHDVIISQAMARGFTIEDSQIAGAEGQAQNQRNRQQGNQQARNQQRGQRGQQQAQRGQQQNRQRQQAAYRQQQQQQQQGGQQGQTQGQRNWREIGQNVFFSQGRRQAGQGQESRWFINQLEPGETKSIIVRGVSDEGGTGYNCLAVTSYTPVLCMATEFVQPEVVVAKAAPERASLCEPVAFRYRITNDGDAVAENVVIRDELPQNLQTDEGDDVVSINVGDLDPGQTEDFTVAIVASEAGSFGSRAVALRDGEMASRSAEPQTRFVLPDLSISIDGPNTVYAGRLLDYDITVANRGNAPAIDTELRLNTPDTAEFLRIRQGNRELTADESDVQAGEVGGAVWEIGDLDPGESTTVSVTLRARERGQKEIIALATARCAEDEAKQQLQTRAATTTEVIALPALVLEVVDEQDPVRVGGDVVYEIVVVNQGQAPDQNVQIVATLPQAMEFVNATGTTQARPQGNKVTFEAIDELGPGERATWNLQARATSDADTRLRLKLTSQYLDQPVNEEEPTRLFSAQQGGQQQRRRNQQQ